MKIYSRVCIILQKERILLGFAVVEEFLANVFFQLLLVLFDPIVIFRFLVFVKYLTDLFESVAAYLINGGAPFFAQFADIISRGIHYGVKLFLLFRVQVELCNKFFD